MADDNGPNDSNDPQPTSRPLQVSVSRILIDGVEVPQRDDAFIHVGVDLARERAEQARLAVDERLDNYARRGWPDAQPQPAVRGEARLDIDFVQQPMRLGALYLTEPAYLRTVDCDPYPQLTKALVRWHANDDASDPARVFPSWRNFGIGRGRGWDVQITATDDDLWTWDSWTAALAVLAGLDDRVVGERRCPECRGRGLVFRWFATIADGLDAYPMHDHDREWSSDGGLGGVLYASSESGRACIGLRCGECRGAKSVDVRLLALVFSAAQGWPWALEQAQAIGDRLQAAGDPWGLWLAALLEPRVRGGWVAYPTRRAVAGDIRERLDETMDRRARARECDPLGQLASSIGAALLPATQNVLQELSEPVRATLSRAGVMAYPVTMPAGWSEYRPTSERFSEADRAFAEVLAGEPITLTFHDDMPHVVTTETVRLVADRLAAEQADDHDAVTRPHSPPIGRGLSRRLERGRRR